MCSGVSIGYFLFVESANSTSPYSRSPSLGLTSSRRSIFGDIDASLPRDPLLLRCPATPTPDCRSTYVFANSASIACFTALKSCHCNEEHCAERAPDYCQSFAARLLLLGDLALRPTFVTWTVAGTF